MMNRAGRNPADAAPMPPLPLVYTLDEKNHRYDAAARIATLTTIQEAQTISSLLQ
jgi:hypothetical protein